MSISINGTNGLTFNDGSSQQTAATGFGFKNRIINGAMMIDQRNAGTSGTANGYTVDRWQYYGTQASKGTWQQNAGSVTPPAGYTNYLGFTSSSAYSVVSTDSFQLAQHIEGFNIADLAWCTANAQPITVSFWVRSSLTGTFGAALNNNGGNYSYPFTYVINSANTWEYKTVTVLGLTTGSINTTNGDGLQLTFCLGAGSTRTSTANSWQSGFYIGGNGCQSVVGTNGATFYITGVQLEKGSTATSFDYRPYGAELFLCQRYLEKSADDNSSGFSGQFMFGNGGVTTGAILQTTCFIVPKRAAPTVTIYDGNTGTVNQVTRSTPGIGSQGGVAASTQGANTRSVQVYSSSGNSHSGIAYFWKAEAEL